MFCALFVPYVTQFDLNLTWRSSVMSETSSLCLFSTCQHTVINLCSSPRSVSLHCWSKEPTLHPNCNQICLLAFGLLSRLSLWLTTSSLVVLTSEVTHIYLWNSFLKFSVWWLQFWWHERIDCDPPLSRHWSAAAATRGCDTLIGQNRQHPLARAPFSLDEICATPGRACFSLI